MSLTILHVEDNRLVADAIRDMLEFEGWRVTLCENGLAGLRELESATHYDLLLLDNELPHLDGWQLIRHARTLAHRQQTPIILTSAHDCATVARSAGADAFLRKPEGVINLISTITRLLHQDA
jgi:CheY-like chemotaxis protein